MTKQRIVLITIILSIIAGVIFAKLILPKVPENIFCFRDLGTHHIPSNFVEVNKSNIVGQTFMPNFDNLFKISVFLSKKDANPDGTLLFHLKKQGEREDIIVRSWKVSQIKPDRKNFYQIPPDIKTPKGFHFHIQFEPIEDSKDKVYYFYFESPQAEPGNGIKLGIWKTKYYEAMKVGARFINHQPVDYFLAFRTFNTWQGDLGGVFEEIRQRLKKDIPFIRVYMSLVLAVFLGIFFLEFRIRKLK
jgi:hypothetical protein